jgi:hypothetical protein
MLVPLIALVAVILLVVIFVAVQGKKKDKGNTPSASD